MKSLCCLVAVFFFHLVFCHRLRGSHTVRKYSIKPEREEEEKKKCPKRKKKRIFWKKENDALLIKKKTGVVLYPPPSPICAREKNTSKLHLAIVKQGKKIQRFWGENLERNVVVFFIILLFVLFDVLLYARIQRL